MNYELYAEMEETMTTIPVEEPADIYYSDPYNSGENPDHLFIFSRNFYDFAENFDSISQNEYRQYANIFSRLDKLTTEVAVMNDNIQSQSSFMVGVFSIILVFILGYIIFDKLFR